MASCVSRFACSIVAFAEFVGYLCLFWDDNFQLASRLCLLGFYVQLFLLAVGHSLSL